MFVEVKTKDLVVGVKYAILLRNDEGLYCTGTFKSKRSGNFHYMKPHSDNIDTYNTLRNMQGMEDLSYYAFVPQKDKIQQDMETYSVSNLPFETVVAY